MTFISRIKILINQILHPFGFKIETLVAEKAENARLEALLKAGHFDRPLISPSFLEPSPKHRRLFDALLTYRSQITCFENSAKNSFGYSFQNNYFSSPDAEILYCMIREEKPLNIIEVGCGNSTRIIRQAMLDGELKTRLTCIDPFPRVEITPLADEFHAKPVEQVGLELFDKLKAGDILFIDSSHGLLPGNDVSFLYLQVLPRLVSGVFIHIHDICLPYDYLEEWVVRQRHKWNEQYLVAQILIAGKDYEVIWPGYHLQKTVKNFEHYFPYAEKRRALSLWLRKSKHDKLVS